MLERVGKNLVGVEGKKNCKQDLYYVKRFIFSIKGKNGLN